jgi:hypothetical protein
VSDGLVRHGDAALGEEVFNVAEAEGEAVVLCLKLTMPYAVNGKQYVAVMTGEGQTGTTRA